MSTKLKNSFGWGEFAGALGDLGIALPLAFVLITCNRFSSFGIFSLWGLVYIFTGWYYKVPISVQPLKVMAVITIASGLNMDIVFTAALIYGIILLALTHMKGLHFLQKLFTIPIIRGVQVGIGLLLARKALEMITTSKLFLNEFVTSTELSLGVVVVSTVFVTGTQWRWKRFPCSLVLMVLGLIFSLLYLPSISELSHSNHTLNITLPRLNLLGSALILLVIPQLPLTLGNAVFAANDAAHLFFKNRAQKVTTKRLATSIGISNVCMGLLGGFPICHGSGGIGAHYKFGGRTGGTTMILGIGFLFVGLVHYLDTIIFLIPIPLLGTLLLFNALAMVKLGRDQHEVEAYLPMLVVALISLLTRNMTFGVLVGIFLEKSVRWLRHRWLWSQKRDRAGVTLSPIEETTNTCESPRY
ncbi:MAG: putative sulfate/molybdate transporter [Gemmatimonadota bacterium]|nr:MAG: putative sulfate/molybdate transporter [Gemmatimonadota bacterium]